MDDHHSLPNGDPMESQDHTHSHAKDQLEVDHGVVVANTEETPGHISHVLALKHV